jgi:hypothetical protein
MGYSVVGDADLRRRQFYVSGTVKGQHESPANHIAQGAVGLNPVPCLAESSREPAATQIGMIGDELANECHTRRVHDTPPVAKDSRRRHARSLGR